MVVMERKSNLGMKKGGKRIARIQKYPLEQAKQVAIDAFRDTCVITMACEAAGVDEGQWWNWRRDDEDFKAQVDSIRDTVLGEKAESVAVELALYDRKRKRNVDGPNVHMLGKVLAARNAAYKPQQGIGTQINMQQINHSMGPAQLAAVAMALLTAQAPQALPEPTVTQQASAVPAVLVKPTDGQPGPR